MGVSKVVLGEETLVDLTSDSVNEENLLKGATAHNASGEKIEGNVLVPTKISQLENDSEFLNNSSTVNFEQASERINIQSSDSIKIILGKVKKWFNDLKPHSFLNPVDNLLTTVPGSSLDATQGKVLNDKISDVTDSLDSTLIFRRKLYDIDDLNSITEKGIYYFNTGSIPKNAPYNDASVVEVVGSPSDNTQTIQRVTRYGIAGESAVRSLGASTWFSWQYYVFKDYLDTVVTNLNETITNISTGLNGIFKVKSFQLDNIALGANQTILPEIDIAVDGYTPICIMSWQIAGATDGGSGPSWCNVFGLVMSTTTIVPKLVNTNTTSSIKIRFAANVFYIKNSTMWS